MTRAMLRRPFTALRSSAANQVPEYYGKSMFMFINICAVILFFDIEYYGSNNRNSRSA